jgi:hypothetical protein
MPGPGAGYRRPRAVTGHTCLAGVPVIANMGSVVTLLVNECVFYHVSSSLESVLPFSFEYVFPRITELES